MAVKYNTAAAFRNTYFDTTGVPLIDGKLYSFKASDHVTPKAIYETNIITPPATTPPAYANPIILDSGASVGPLYYASDENYYLELRDKDDAVIATVDNWNSAENQNPEPGATDIDVTNYISNADFSIISANKYTEDQLGITALQIADPNWYYIRSNVNANITIEFEEFPLGQTDVPNTPLRKYKYSCTSVGAGGETFNDLYYQIEDVRSLSGQEVTLSFNGRSDTSRNIEILVNQYFGSGGSASVETSFGAESLTPADTVYTKTFTIPSIAGKVIAPNNEVGYLQIIFRMPLNQISDVELTIFQLNRGDIKLEYNYLTRAQVNKDSIGLMIPERPIERYYGTNGGDITYDWSLQYFTGVGFIWDSPFPVGLTVQDFSGENYVGWVNVSGANELPVASFPRLFAYYGVKYGEHFAAATVLTDTVTIIGLANGSVTDANAGTSGFTVTVTQQGTAVLPEIFTVQTVAASSITPGSYFTFSTAEGSFDFVVWITINGAGVYPTGVATTALNLALDINDNADAVAAKLHAIVNPIAFGLPDTRGYFIRSQDNGAGIDPDAATRIARPDGASGDNVGTTQPDQNLTHAHTASFEEVVGGTGLAGGGSFAAISAALPTTVSGGAESRPKNMNARLLMKY